MATGITSTFNLTRNEVVASALRKVKGWPEDGNPSVSRLRDAVKALSIILRQEDVQGIGIKKNLWALDSKALFLSTGGYIYSSAEGLPNIIELFSVSLRDTMGSDSHPLDLITAEEYAALSPKNQTGDPDRVYLQKGRIPSEQKLYIWSAPTSVGTTSEVRQDNVMYSCILSHTSAAINKPGSGSSWKIYWQVKTEEDVGADTWAVSTTYTNGKALFLTFKRPLFDFTTQYDNPDMPPGWGNYLIYKLAVDLAPEYQVSDEAFARLERQLMRYEREIAPSARADSNTYHNKAKYF
jgi:hypothetical protein